MYQPRTTGIAKTRLNDKQLLFIYAYLADNKMDASAAAVKAGYVKTMGAKLRKHKLISAEINRQIKRRLDGLEISAHRVLEELAALGFSNPKNCINPETGTLYHLSEMPDYVAASIRDISVTTNRDGDQTMTLSYYDKMGPLQLLYRHVGLDNDANPGGADDDAKLAASKLIPLLLSQAKNQASNTIDADYIEKKA